MLYGFKIAASINNEQLEAQIVQQLTGAMQAVTIRTKSLSAMNANVVCEYLDLCDSEPSKKDQKLYAEGVRLLTTYLTTASSEDITVLVKRSVVAQALKEVIDSKVAAQGITRYQSKYH